LGEIVNKLGVRFIIGGDFNIKHTAWGSRVITPGKGNELLRVITENKCEFLSSGNPTYWPADINKTPDLLDFFITKGISTKYMEVKDIYDLSSDHSPVSLTLGMEISQSKRKSTLTNKYASWSIFREHVDDKIKLKIKLKSESDIENQAEMLIEHIREASKAATPEMKERGHPIGLLYNAEIRLGIKERRRA